MRTYLILGLIGLQLSVASRLDAQYWVEFRGENGVGHSAFKNIPTKWDEDSSNLSWRTELDGLGWSSPVIANDRIWLTSADADQKKIMVQILGLNDGKLQKQVTLFEKPLGRIHKKNSHASPTAILDKDLVFVHFGEHGTAALDMEGNVVWKKEFDYGHFHGPGGSPVVVDDKLIISCDGGDSQYLVALNKADGKEVWRTKKKHIHPARFSGGKMKAIAFCTPSVRKVGDRNEVVVCGADHIAGFDANDGKELWWAAYDGYSVVPRPVFFKDMVYYSSSYNSPVLYGLKLGGDGDLTGNVVWEMKKHAPHNPTPLVVDDMLFTVSDRGIAQCVDAATGKVHWQERMGRAYSASPIYVDGKVYFQDETGGTTVVKPSRTYEVISKNKLGGRTLATPVPIPNGLLIRTDKELIRIDSSQDAVKK